MAGGDGIGPVLQRYIRKDKHMRAGLGADGDTVEQKRNLGLVGVYLDISLSGSSVGKAAACYMDKRLFAPPSLVDVEGILFDLSVIGHQTFIISATAAALIPGISGKVKHVPRGGRP